MIQMQNIRAEIVPLIRDVLIKLTGRAHDNEVKLMLGTAAAESGLVHRRQLGGGPARGLWQMEPTTGQDIFATHLIRHRYQERFNKLMDIWLEIGIAVFTPYIMDIDIHLGRYDDFACAMARIHYLRDPDPIPDALEEQAAYWKRVYNTPAGAGTVEHYLEAWESCKCEELINDW